MYVDIYLYAEGVSVDCGAFSCSCGRAGVGWWCLCMNVCNKSRFVPCGVVCWCGGVYMYLCI